MSFVGLCTQQHIFSLVCFVDLCTIDCIPLVFVSQYYVELEKNPTLGLGITGGVGGENAIKPGDQVSLSLSLTHTQTHNVLTDTI